MEKLNRNCRRFARKISGQPVISKSNYIEEDRSTFPSPFFDPTFVSEVFATEHVRNKGRAAGNSRIQSGTAVINLLYAIWENFVQKKMFLSQDQEMSPCPESKGRVRQQLTSGMVMQRL
jgi:hypothetical protein